jgi:hypothetical protein
LRVRDPRISAKSLVGLREKSISAGAVATEAVEGVPQKLRNNGSSYSWGSAARLLGVDVGQVREWIVEGKLKIADGFVTERAFQDFCNKRGLELNSALLGNEVRDWLVDGYSLPISDETVRPLVPGNQKHALVTRRCPGCRRPMRGNIFFRHVKTCTRRQTERALVAFPSLTASAAVVDLNMKHEPTFDSLPDYEPPYDLQAAQERIEHMEQVSSDFKNFMDRLCTQSQTVKGRSAK